MKNTVDSRPNDTPKKKSVIFATMMSAGLGYVGFEASTLVADGLIATLLAKKLKLPSLKRVNDLMAATNETGLRHHGTKFVMAALFGGYGLLKALDHNRNIKSDVFPDR
jgi:hypothetical protein